MSSVLREVTLPKVSSQTVSWGSSNQMLLEHTSLASLRFLLRALGGHGSRPARSSSGSSQSRVQVAVLGLGAAGVVTDMSPAHRPISALVAGVWHRAALGQL